MKTHLLGDTQLRSAPDAAKPQTCRRRRSPRTVLAGLCAIAALVLVSPGWARQADPNFWVTNGVLRSTALSGNTLYIGGAFDYVGPFTGGFVNVDATSSTVK